MAEVKSSLFFCETCCIAFHFRSRACIHRDTNQHRVYEGRELVP